MDLTVSDVGEILLGSNGPRDAAKRTLDWLLGIARARSIALWSVSGDGLRLELSVGADADTLEQAASLWAHRDPGAVERDGRVDGAAAVLVPTRPPDHLVYVDGVVPNMVKVSTLADAGAVVVKALVMSSRGGGIHRTSETLRREELIATLHLHEWNIARVARVKGVTRKTIYDWLEKYQITREHVEKS